jgi:hypothetical protein
VIGQALQPFQISPFRVFGFLLMQETGDFPVGSVLQFLGLAFGVLDLLLALSAQASNVFVVWPPAA